jgi:hypothetical protein
MYSNIKIQYCYIHLTKRPGKCTQFIYEFKTEGSMLHSANSRPIPIALRNQVCEQIPAMLKDEMLEESHSAHINSSRGKKQFVFV